MIGYKTLPQYPGYRFGNDGSVESAWTRRPAHDALGRFKGMDYFVGNWYQRVGAKSTCKGYLRTILKDAARKRKNKFIHNLICEAFHGPRPGGVREFHAAHINGNPLDNRAENLKWATVRENVWEDAVRHGTHRSLKYV